MSGSILEADENIQIDSYT